VLRVAASTGRAGVVLLRAIAGAVAAGTLTGLFAGL
jgi:hypothetical protein